MIKSISEKDMFDTLTLAFKLEIANTIETKDNSIIVYLNNGTIAKISIEKFIL